MIHNILPINFIAHDIDNNTIVGSLSCDKDIVENILKGIYTKFKILGIEEMEGLDQEYICAYDIVKKSLKLNIEKVRNIKKDLLRVERSHLLKKLDVDFMLAIENDDNETKLKIVSEKKRLRDITNLVDLASTVEEIKAVTI